MRIPQALQVSYLLAEEDASSEDKDVFNLEEDECITSPYVAKHLKKISHAFFLLKGFILC